LIPARSFANCDVGVFGLARTGLSSVASLRAGGARVYAWDDNEVARATAERAGATVLPYQKWPWDRIKALILSPGVPLTHPKPHDIVATACAAGAEVIGDIELFAREIRPDAHKPGRSPVIAITGTNGKSTTTALVSRPKSAAISASRCLTSRRRTAARSMCWRFHLTRSTLRPASCRT
jgi:UDP-N-acetylmuramoylalanine--D-glutamate ligase